MAKITALPADVLREILKNLPYPVLERLAFSDKRFSSILDDPKFWTARGAQLLDLDTEDYLKFYNVFYPLDLEEGSKLYQYLHSRKPKKRQSLSDSSSEYSSSESDTSSEEENFEATVTEKEKIPEGMPYSIENAIDFSRYLEMDTKAFVAEMNLIHGIVKITRTEEILNKFSSVLGENGMEFLEKLHKELKNLSVRFIKASLEKYGIYKLPKVHEIDITTAGGADDMFEVFKYVSKKSYNKKGIYKQFSNAYQ